METTFSCCEGPLPPFDAHQLIELLVQVGGEVLDADERPLHPAPDLETGRNLLGTVVLRHPALASEDGGPGLASVSFLAAHGLASLSQSSLPDDEAGIDAVASGQLRLALLLYPLLRPRCAWVDEPGGSQPRSYDVRRKRFRCLFWSSLFGPAYVGALGRSFLLGAPGWKVEPLADGGVLYAPSRSYLQWWREEPVAVLDYFQRRFPDVRIYRAVQPA